MASMVMAILVLSEIYCVSNVQSLNAQHMFVIEKAGSGEVSRSLPEVGEVPNLPKHMRFDLKFTGNSLRKGSFPG